MGKFDIKDFLQENKLTEVSQVNEEFIEIMDRELEEGVELIIKAYKKWAKGSETKDSQLKPAKREILRYLEKELDKIR